MYFLKGAPKEDSNSLHIFVVRMSLRCPHEETLQPCLSKVQADPNFCWTLMSKGTCYGVAAQMVNALDNTKLHHENTPV